MWIIGDSYVYWAQKRAIKRQIANDLGLKGVSKIRWKGIRGMSWDRLMIEVQYLSLHNSAPRVIIIHLGSNDICTVKCNVLRQNFRSDILAISSLFPSTSIMVSALLSRLTWSVSYAPKKVEQKRKLLNRFLRRLTVFLGGHFIPHEDIGVDTPGLYYRDGIHLSDVGCDMFLLSVKHFLEKMLSN